MSKYLIFALVFALLNIGMIFAVFGVREYSDGTGYVEIINWLQGQAGAPAEFHRLLKPLGLLIALPFEFLGDGAGLIIQNIFFYLLSSFLIFKIAELLYGDKKQALLASVFFTTATPVIEVSTSHLLDIGGWFFYLLSIFLTLLYFKTRDGRLVILNGLLSGLGFLVKETGGFGILFFGLMVLFSAALSIKEKIIKIAHFAAFFLIPVLIVQILVFKYYQITYWDWFWAGRLGAEVGKEGLVLISLRYLGQLFRILGVLWPLILIGIWRELREKNWQRIKVFLALLPASFSFLFWQTGGGGRVVFIFAPLGILLATYGCKKIRPPIMAPLVLAILILNYSFVAVNQAIPFTDIIYTSLFKVFLKLP